MSQSREMIEPTPSRWRRFLVAVSEHPGRFLTFLLGVTSILGLAITYSPSPPGFNPRIFPLEVTSPFAGQPSSLDADRSGRYLVTTGATGAVTVWVREAADHWQPTVIRAPRREEFAGAKYLSAITADAAYLALAVPPLAGDRGRYQTGSARIYIFDRARQRIVTTFTADIPTYVTRLRFSPDGKYLAALLSGGCGLRIWSSPQWRSQANDLTPRLRDEMQPANASGASSCCPRPQIDACEGLPRGVDLAFSDGADAKQWLFALSTKVLAIYPPPSGDLDKPFAPAERKPVYVSLGDTGLRQPSSLAVSPDLSRIAIGDGQDAHVIVLAREGIEYRARTFGVPARLLSPKGISQTQSHELFLPTAAWRESATGISLLAYGFFPSRSLKDRDPDDETNNVVVFDYANPDEVKFKEVQGEPDTFLYISQLSEPSAPPKTVYVSTEHIAVIDPSDLASARPKLIAANKSVSYRGFDDTYRLILDRRNNFYFSTRLDGRYALFNVDFDALRVSGPAYPGDKDQTKSDLASLIDKSHFFARDVNDRRAWRYGDRVGDGPPVFFNRPLPVDNLYANELSLSAIDIPPITGANEAPMVVWGTDRAIRVISDGGKIMCTRPVTSEAQRMNVTADGQFLVVAHGDGVIRWYALGFGPASCLPLVLSFYVTQNDHGDWGYLAWLPDGRFATGGGVGAGELACYPVEVQGRPTACIDLQRNLSLYAPDALRNVLREAPHLRGPHGAAFGIRNGLRRLAAGLWPAKGIVGAAFWAQAMGMNLLAVEQGDDRQLVAGVQASIAEQAKANSVVLTVDVPPDAADEKLVAKVTMSNWDDGKPRYLTFRANDRDVAVVYNGKQFAEGHPIEIASPDTPTVSLTLILPKAVQSADRGPFQLCPFVYAGIREDGTSAPGTEVAQASSNPCLAIAWKGSPDLPPNRVKRKLWAFIIGFSQAATNPLLYAHDDALDLARFLQRDFRQDLPPPGNGGGSAFDDIKIFLFIAPPGDYKPDAIEANPKVKLLWKDLGDEKLHIIYMLPNQNPRYDDRVKSELALFAEAIADEEAGEKKDWEHDVLIYFAGHGSSSPIDYELRLDTPSVNDTRQFGFLKFYDIVRDFSKSQARFARAVFIVDACRAVPGQKSAEKLETDYISHQSHLNYIDTKTKWDFYFSTGHGGYSYEESAFGLSDMITGFDLWQDNSVPRTGNGVFTLGLITSLVCGDTIDYPIESAYNLLGSERYLHNYFFSLRNQRWTDFRNKLIPKLDLDGIKFIPPVSQYINGADDDPLQSSFVFRLLHESPRRCFASGH